MESTKTANDTFPTTWRWDKDGPSVSGTYLRMDEAATDYGRSAIVVLDVDGQERSIWLFDAALTSKFREEVAKRQAGDFTRGERVEIHRGAEKVKSANDRSYWPYRVTFPGAPKRSAGDILGIGGGPFEPELPVDAPADDEIPF